MRRSPGKHVSAAARRCWSACWATVPRANTSARCPATRRKA